MTLVNQTGMIAEGPCTGAHCQSAGSALDDIADYLNIMWVMLCGFLVLSMQFGFAMLEVGSCRQAHRMTVLTKNIMDSAVSALAFWAFCHWGDPPSLITDGKGMIQNHLLLFHYAFGATSVTICSGAMAERTHMLAYIFYSIVMAGWIYPVVATAVWGDGTSLLAGEFHGRLHEGYRYHDAAGSGVVHLVGGCSAIVGNAFLGRRIMPPASDSSEDAAQNGHLSDLERGGRTRPMQPITEMRPIAMVQRSIIYSERSQEPCTKPQGGWPRRFDAPKQDLEEFVPVHYLQAMGMFTLWIGWYGFNCGSTLSMDHAGSAAASLMAWNTTLAASAGGLGSALYCYLFRRNLDITHMCNGVVSGLVSVTAGCDVATEGVACLVGLAAGMVVYPWSNNLLQCLKMDDPPCAIAVHAFCGLFGVLAAGFYQPPCAHLESLGGGQAEQVRFCLPGHDWRLQLAAQAWGAFTLIWWTISISLVLWSAFAFSEVTRSLEAIQLQQVDRHLQTLLPERTVEERCSDEASELAELHPGCVASCSKAVRRALKEHGFNGVTFDQPEEIPSLRTKLRRFKEQHVDTALEVEHFPLMHGAAKLIRCIPVVRSMMIVRLRIPPKSELSGLGHANGGGGHILKALQMALSMQQEDNKSAIKLERQVRELAQIVQSQDSLLQAVTRPRDTNTAGSDRGRSSHCGSRASHCSSRLPGSAASTASNFNPGARRGDDTPLASAWSEISERSDPFHAINGDALQGFAEQVARAMVVEREVLAALLATMPNHENEVAHENI